MRLNRSATDRLLAGERPADAVDLTSVAAFLSVLPDALPPAKVGDVRDAHLDAITREARVVAAAAPPRTLHSTRRLVVTAVAAGLGVLTMGAGVAAAVGANPLSFLPNLLPIPASSARVDTPASLDPSAQVPSGAPLPPPATRSPESAPGQPTPGTPGSSASNNGKSDEARSEHSPTAKPSHSNNGKSGEKGERGRSEDNPGNGASKDTPGKGKATAEATNNARTDPPGKTRSGD